jgi:hypothetical protein
VEVELHRFLPQQQMEVIGELYSRENNLRYQEAAGAQEPLSTLLRPVKSLVPAGN